MLGGCGNSPKSCLGKVDPAQCWPELATFPQGSAELGTGRDAFEPMPDLVQLEYGPQGGFNVVANVQMTGFAPGNPQNVLDDRNPRTRIREFFADTNVSLDYSVVCPFR